MLGIVGIGGRGVVQGLQGRGEIGGAAGNRRQAHRWIVGATADSGA